MDRKYFSVGKVVSASFLFSVFFGIATVNAEPPAPPPPPPPPPAPSLSGQSVQPKKSNQQIYEECISSPNFIPGRFERGSLPGNFLGAKVSDYYRDTSCLFMIGKKGEKIAPDLVIATLIDKIREDFIHPENIDPKAHGLGEEEKAKRERRKTGAEGLRLNKYLEFYKKFNGNGASVRNAMENFIKEHFSLKNYPGSLFKCPEGSLVRLSSRGNDDGAVFCLMREKPNGRFLWKKIAMDPSRIVKVTSSAIEGKNSKIKTGNMSGMPKVSLKGDVIFEGKLNVFDRLTLNELGGFPNILFIPNLFDISFVDVFSKESEQYKGKYDGDVMKVGGNWYKWVKNQWVPGQENEYVWIETDAPEGAKSFDPEKSTTSHPTHSAGNVIPDNWLRKSRPSMQPSISFHPEADQRSNLHQEMLKGGVHLRKTGLKNSREEVKSSADQTDLQNQQMMSRSVMKTKSRPEINKKLWDEMGGSQQEFKKASFPKLKSTRQPVMKEEQTNGMDPELFKILQKRRGMSSSGS